MKGAVFLLAVLLLAGISEAKTYPGYSTWLDYYRSLGYSDDVKAGAEGDLITLTKGDDYVVLNTRIPKNSAQKAKASQGTYLGYSDNMAFLVPDSDWRGVMAFTSVALWAGSDADKSWCTTVYGAGSPYTQKCAYPLLIYHQEGDSYDLDSILHFLQQYGAKRVVHVGGLSDKLRDAITRATGNPPIQADPSKPYVFWRQPTKYVYVSDKYDLAMLAAQYASYTNSPLIIKGQSSIPQDWWQKASTIEGGLVCVGEAPAPGVCEVWDKQRLFDELLMIVPSDKVLAVDSGDLVACGRMFYVTKTGDKLTEFYCRDSLIAPYLAAAKEELIVDLGAGGRENNIGISDDDGEQVVSRAATRLKDLFSRLAGASQLGQEPITRLASHFTFLISPAAGDKPSIGWDDDGTKVIDRIYGSASAKRPQYGRVFGLTVSDTSAYISRSIFLDRIQLPPRSKDIIGLFAGWDADFAFTTGSKIGDPLYSENDIKSERPYFTIARRVTPAYLGKQQEQPNLASIKKSAKSGTYAKECIDTDSKHVTDYVTPTPTFAWFDNPDEFGMIIADGKIVSTDECRGAEIRDKPGHTPGINEMRCYSDGTYSETTTYIGGKICSVAQGALINDADSAVDSFMSALYGEGMTISLCSNRADKDCLDEKTACAESKFTITDEKTGKSEELARVVPRTCKFRCVQGYGCVEEGFCTSVAECPDADCYTCTASKCQLKAGKRYCTNGKGCIENTKCCDCEDGDWRCNITPDFYSREDQTFYKWQVLGQKLKCLPAEDKCNITSFANCWTFEAMPSELSDDEKRASTNILLGAIFPQSGSMDAYCTKANGCIGSPMKECADGREIPESGCCEDCKEGVWDCTNELTAGKAPALTILASHLKCQQGKCVKETKQCANSLPVPALAGLSMTELININLEPYSKPYCTTSQGCIKYYGVTG